MSFPLLLITISAGALLSLVSSTLTYALRDLSRSRLADELERRGQSKWLESTLARQDDLIFVTAFCRLTANTLIVLTILDALYRVARIGPLYFFLGGAGGVDDHILQFGCPSARAGRDARAGPRRDVRPSAVRLASHLVAVHARDGSDSKACSERRRHPPGH